MKKLEEMNDKKLRRDKYITLIVVIIGALAIFVLSAEWFDNFFSHILSASSFILAFYLILYLLDDISTDINNIKRAKGKDKFDNKKVE